MKSFNKVGQFGRLGAGWSSPPLVPTHPIHLIETTPYLLLVMILNKLEVVPWEATYNYDSTFWSKTNG